MQNGMRPALVPWVALLVVGTGAELAAQDGRSMMFVHRQRRLRQVRRHPSRNCTQGGLRGTGGNGLFHCLATR